jgi:hypothetical protein
VLDAVEIIGKWFAYAEASNCIMGEVPVNDEILKQAKHFVPGRFGTTPQQALFLTTVFIITNEAENEFGYMAIEANFTRIAKKLKISTVEMLRYISDIDVLVEQGIFTTDDEINKTRQNFRITPDAVNAILSDLPFLATVRGETGNMLLRYIKQQDYQLNKCSREGTGGSSLVNYINSLGISTEKKILFFKACGCTTFSDGIIKLISLADILFSDATEKKQFLMRFSSGGSKLISEDLIEADCGEILSEIEVSLSQKALQMYLGDEAELYTDRRKHRDVITPDSIVPRNLYFSEENLKRLSEFESVLDPDNFTFLQERLCLCHDHSAKREICRNICGTGAKSQEKEVGTVE